MRYQRGRGSRRGNHGQALVELALVLPLILLMWAALFTGWDGIQRTIGLTSAARAGAIVASRDLNAGQDTNAALKDAVDAINQEEGVTGVYRKSTPGCANDCVSLSQSIGPGAQQSGLTVNLVTITISHAMAADLPLVSDVHLLSQATARY